MSESESSTREHVHSPKITKMYANGDFLVKCEDCHAVQTVSFPPICNAKYVVGMRMDPEGPSWVNDDETLIDPKGELEDNEDDY